MTPITREYYNYKETSKLSLADNSNSFAIILYKDACDPSAFRNPGRELVAIKGQLNTSLSSLKRNPDLFLKYSKEKYKNKCNCKNKNFDDVEKTFNSLATKWQNDTKFLSDINEISLHPDHQRIIGMGDKIIPLILNRLAEKPSYWFWALKAITREDPVPPSDRGDIIEMTNHWLDWGHEHGYRD
jgi:hypothetical protein